ADRVGYPRRRRREFRGCGRHAGPGRGGRRAPDESSHRPGRADVQRSATLAGEPRRIAVWPRAAAGRPPRYQGLRLPPLATENDQFKVHLEAGRRYPIKVATSPGATLRLGWKTPAPTADTSLWS